MGSRTKYNELDGQGRLVRDGVSIKVLPLKGKLDERTLSKLPMSMLGGDEEEFDRSTSSLFQNNFSSLAGPQDVYPNEQCDSPNRSRSVLHGRIWIIILLPKLDILFCSSSESRPSKREKD